MGRHIKRTAIKSFRRGYADGKKPVSRKTTKKKMQFSKKIFIGVSAMTIAVTVYTLVIVWRTGDTSALMYLIPAVFAELATATGFYYRKAEKENTKGGITYDAAMRDAAPNDETPPDDMPQA